MKGMTVKEMAKAVNGVVYAPESFEDREVSSITIDSRKVEEDGLFIAIKGERSDGHDYIDSCFDKGALCVISEKELNNPKGAYIKVESSLQALKDLATLYRGNLTNLKVVGITGSVGKTSTKETIYSVLSTKYNTLKTLGNFNNEIGLPLTVFRIEDDTEIAVLEMGISDFNEMTRLAKIARPDIVVITNIGYCHLENLGDRDGVLKAKTEVFDYVKEGGKAILNGDDDKLATVKEVKGSKPIFFGESKTNDIYADEIESLGLDGTRFKMHNLKTADGVGEIVVTCPVPGSHMVLNCLAAAAVACEFNLSSTEIIEGISNLKTIAGRNNIIKTGKLTVIDDCYNANPVSMKASIDVLAMANTRKVALLGDMFELGTEEKELHRGVGEYIKDKDIDLVLTIGDLAKNIYEGLEGAKEAHHFNTKDEFRGQMTNLINENDSILVKASHGMHFEELVEELKNF